MSCGVGGGAPSTPDQALLTNLRLPHPRRRGSSAKGSSGLPSTGNRAQARLTQSQDWDGSLAIQG
jgi:hypothetical protein